MRPNARVTSSVHTAPWVAWRTTTRRSSSQTFRDYFSKILPDHDRERVHINDIKKCIKWYNFMYENGILQEAKLEAAAQKAAEAPAEEPVIAEKPEKSEKPEKPEKAEKVEKPVKALKKA